MQNIYTGPSLRKRLDDEIKFIKDAKPNLSNSKVLPTALNDDELRQTSLERRDTLLQSVQHTSKTVPLTPYGMKLHRNGEMGVPEGRKVQLTSKITIGEAQIMRDCAKIGFTHYWHKHGFITDYFLTDVTHWACVDFWRNYLKMGPEVTPDTYPRRLKNLSAYSKPKSFMPDFDTLAQAFNWVSQNLAINIESISLNDPDIREQAKFAKKEANVGAPFYMNSAREFHGRRADDLALELAKTLDPSEMKDFTAALGARDQRSGYDPDMDKLTQLIAHQEEDLTLWVKALRKRKDSKARVIYMFSRAENYVAAQIVSPYMKAVASQCGYYVALNDDDYISKKITAYIRLCSELNLTTANIDFDSFDTTVSAELLALCSIMIQDHISDDRGKEICRWTFVSAIYKPIIFMVDDTIKLLRKFGAIPSGWAFTNGAGTLINILAVTYGKMKHYGVDEVLQIERKLVASGTIAQGQGDDHHSWFKSHRDIAKIGQVLKSDLGLLVNERKGELGAFFLQHRYDTPKVTSPLPRMWSKTWFVERAKHLYNAMWTMVNYSKWDRCVNTPGFEEAVQYINNYDEDHWGTVDYRTGNPSSPEILSQRLAEESVALDTSEKGALFDGDPSFENNFNGEKVAGAFIRSRFQLYSELIAV